MYVIYFQTSVFYVSSFIISPPHLRKPVILLYCIDIICILNFLGNVYSVRIGDLHFFLDPQSLSLGAIARHRLFVLLQRIRAYKNSKNLSIISTISKLPTEPLACVHYDIAAYCEKKYTARTTIR